ncbi:MAG: hypothetical protein Q9187_002283 [Circinaria calcarea]
MSGDAEQLPDRPSKRHILSRADEVSTLLNAVQNLVIPYIRAADEDAGTKSTGHELTVKEDGPRTALVEHHKPQKLGQLLDLQLPDISEGQDGFLKFVQKSYNASNIASELILAVLNTNLHIYQISPALTIIEKTTSKTLANLFGLSGPHAGGISAQGGSASNTTSIVIARNMLFPDTKENGNFASGRKLVLFTSAYGHYSIEKAAQMLGFGSASVWSVPIDDEGRMKASELKVQIKKAEAEGYTPFYVNATAGTTVLGSYDPSHDISKICRTHNLWFHIDASWGGPAIFSAKHSHKMAGSEKADSIAINPHKMMGVPITCSFLLGADMRKFHKTNTLPAGYLFHSEAGINENTEVYDLADLTLQCGRRGDSLKLALGWIYYGKTGYASQVNRAFDTAAYISDLSLRILHPVYKCVSTTLLTERSAQKPKATRKQRRISLSV